MPLTDKFGVAGALGTVRMLTLLLAAVDPAEPDINLAEKSWVVFAVRPENVLPVCHAPVPLRYCVVQPAGAVIALKVTLVVVLLSSTGAAGLAGAFGTLMVLDADHAPSAATSKAPVPL